MKHCSWKKNSLERRWSESLFSSWQPPPLPPFYYNVIRLEKKFSPEFGRNEIRKTSRKKLRREMKRPSKKKEEKVSAYVCLWPFLFSREGKGAISPKVDKKGEGEQASFIASTSLNVPTGQSVISAERLCASAVFFAFITRSQTLRKHATDNTTIH